MVKETIVDFVPDADSTEQSTGRLPHNDEESNLSSSNITFGDDEDETIPETTDKAETPVNKEDTAFFTVRTLVFAVLVMSTLGVSLGAFFFLRNSERSNFRNSFEDDSIKIFDAVSARLDQSIGTMDSYVASLASYASAVNMTWPFVTLPDSEIRLSKARTQSQAIDLQQLHVLPTNLRDLYREHTSLDSEWASDTVTFQQTDKGLNQSQLETEVDNESIDFISWDGSAPEANSQLVTTWQSYPLFQFTPSYNVDLSSHPFLGRAIKWGLQEQQVVLSEVLNLAKQQQSGQGGLFELNFAEPVSSILFPVEQKESETAFDNSWEDGVALLKLSFEWSTLLGEILQKGETGVLLVVENTCGQVFSYRIDGEQASFLGAVDAHDEQFEDMEIVFDISDLLGRHADWALSKEFCAHTLRTFPTKETKSSFYTAVPLVLTLSTVFIFLFTSGVFIVYDTMVNKRQQKVLEKENIRDRLIREEQAKKNKKSKSKKPLKNKSKAFEGTKTRMKSFLKEDDSRDELDLGDADFDRPIADLFPETTIMFADISGFTAWSSVREPSQVFTLLEKIYGAFDRLATRKGVFKVETIGDSYVAVAGLPEPREDHAVCMVKFAEQCRHRFADITRELEFSLGPETGDLRMRFGLNSGPTTAGVLRGQKSRFQLFGDTVNTAARMESTGEADFIQVSQATATQVQKAGKGHWLAPREEKIDVKGKGLMQTYFVDTRNRGDGLSISLHSTSVESTSAEAAHKNERMVYWCTDILAKILKQIIARRKVVEQAKSSSFDESDLINPTASSTPVASPSFRRQKKNPMVIEEVVEIIHLPEFEGVSQDALESEIIVSNTILTQLREYVTEISGTYRENPFHNFEHASHVVMSVAKLLSRIVAPDQVLNSDSASQDDLAATLHDYTYGITSDPLTQFACMFAALIHDCDHYGIPNNQLLEEKAPLAYRYKNRSPAEQNSVNIAWKILMKSQYAGLRATICPTEVEMNRFRQLVVNSVMATDIADKQMKVLRNDRWARAFAENPNDNESERDRINRKATIVIEHLIQASDVAHTMQHWHVYTKWNERLFQEMSLAYLVGRADKDPVEFWYKGELGFFDFYIIPLAKKLSECGVFGVSSDEYLNYATRNREEWERRGNEILKGMISRFEQKVNQEYGDLRAVHSTRSLASFASEE